jgi:hypothetical protein
LLVPPVAGVVPRSGYALPGYNPGESPHSGCHVGRKRPVFTFHIIAVSGEVTLHSDRLYVQVSQPATGHDSGILFRICEGREDYVGGANNFSSLDLLSQPKELARLIKEKCGV